MKICKGCYKTKDESCFENGKAQCYRCRSKENSKIVLKPKQEKPQLIHTDL